MKKLYQIAASVVLLFLAGARPGVSAQSFHKGALLVSLSEGTTYTNFTTTNNAADVINRGHIRGDRDPLTVEYGLTKHWGIGLNMGGDILYVNPASYYDFQATNGRAKVITSEFTLDVHYHYLVTRRGDLSAFASFGASSVNINGVNGDSKYNYNAGGAIARIGTEGRYYFCKHFGVLGMMSAYSSNCSTKGIKANNVANNYSTGISGYAWELGICFRLLR